MTFKYRYRKQIIIISLFILVIGLLVFSYFYYFKEEKHEDEEIKLVDNELEKKYNKKNIEKKKEDQEVIEEIMVDVKGEVNASGIYKLKVGSRVIDAINMAGGLTNNANTSVLNLSKKLTDEMVIIVYSNYEVENFDKTKEKESIIIDNCKNANEEVINDACIDNKDSIKNEETNQKVSINNATIEDLMKLPGVGEAKAKSIIEYREQNGGFKAIEEIKNVTGIGESLFDQIKENITL